MEWYASDTVRASVRDQLAPLENLGPGRAETAIRTLATYLDRGGKYDETAQALSIHRNTLRYRLSRIAEISGHDLADTETRLNLHLATRAWRLRIGPSAWPDAPSS